MYGSSGYKTFDIFWDNPKITKQNKPKDLVPTNFVGVIFGKPNVGKTFLISKLLKSHFAFDQKFHIVLIVSPSAIPDIPADEDYWTQEFSVDWVKDKLRMHRDNIEMMKLDKIKKKRKRTSYESSEDTDESAKIKSEKDLTSTKEKNTLIDNNLADISALVIWDDQMPAIKDNEHNSAFKTLITNRRHIIPGVVISHLFTGQVYTGLPKFLRDISTMFISFENTPQVLEQIIKEHVGINWRSIRQKIFDHFSNNPHNFIYIHSGSVWGNFDKVLS